MGYYCTVPQCTSLAGKTKNVKFHRFPRDVTMADKWNSILKRGKPYTKYSKVCSLHFTQSDYNVTTMGQWKTLSKDAVPSQNLPRLNPDGTPMVIRKSRSVKYRDGRKDSQGDKCQKWSGPLPHTPMSVNAVTTPEGHPDIVVEPSNAYRLQALSAIASALPPQIPPHQPLKPKKQDAFMQTDPIASEDDDLHQPNNSYSETSDASFNSVELEYQKEYLNQQYKEKGYDKDYMQFKDEKYGDKKDYTPKPHDYTKQEDYIPQTNEEYNKEAEKYALERKSLNSYEKQPIDYQKPDYQKQDYQKQDYQKQDYQKPDYQKHDYQKLSVENGYLMLPDYMGYSYTDSVEMLRNQQHNLEMLQQHRTNENQNFFNENHIKQEIDMNSEEEKYMYERAKDQLDASAMYGVRGATPHRLLEHLAHVKQEPLTPDVTGCESVLQPQVSPYYAAGHNDDNGGYYEHQRPGPEALIAKQNALAAHTQLWQNTMKRPFFYSETPHYPPIHRYEDVPRILQ